MQFTKAMVESLMTKVPALHQRAVELLAAELTDGQLATSKRKAPKRKAATRAKPNRVPRGQHVKMAVEVLDALNAISEETGVVSKDLRAKGKELNHEFGAGMNAVFDGLATKKLVKYKAVSKKDAKKPRYKWWLAKPKAEVLEALDLNVAE